MNYAIKEQKQKRAEIVSFWRGEEGREEISEPEKHSRKVNSLLFYGNVANISDILKYY